MFKNKMLVLLSLVSFGSVLCSNGDEPKGYMDRANNTIKKITNTPLFPTAVALLVSTGSNIFLNGKFGKQELTHLAPYASLQNLTVFPSNFLAMIPFMKTPVEFISFLVSKSKLVSVIMGYAASAPFSNNEVDQLARLITSVVGSQRGL